MTSLSPLRSAPRTAVSPESLAGLLADLGAHEEAPGLRRVQEIHLVEHEDARDADEVEIGEERLGGLDVLVHRRIGRVHDVEQEVRVRGLLEGGAEGREQILGQVTDEPDRVGDDHLALLGEADPPRSRVEGREEAVLDEDLGHLYLRRAGLLPEQTLGIARFCTFVEPKDRWFAIDGGSDEHGDSYPVVPIVEGALVFHPGPDATALTAQLRSEAPLSLGADVLAGTHTEVLNWKAIGDAVHVRVQHPPPTPSPFPYLPSSPQELLRAYLEVVGIRSFDCTSAQVTIDRPYSLIGRIHMGTTNVGSAQPCADGKPRQRLHGARRVVVSYRDRPEYAAGRERWQQYQTQVLLAHLERATNVRAPVVPDELPDNPVVRAGARFLDLAEKASSFGEWQPPPPYRYCWPVVG